MLYCLTGTLTVKYFVVVPVLCVTLVVNASSKAAQILLIFEDLGKARQANATITN